MDPMTTSVLARCEGFAVHTPAARVGTVEEVRLAGEERPAELTVRAGLLGSWRLIVPVDQVLRVSARERKIVLRPGALLAGPRP
jgi:hypothetical protein